GHEMGRRRQILDDGHMRLRSGVDRRLHARRGQVEQLARSLAMRHPRAVLAAARPVLAGLSQRLHLAPHAQIAHRRDAVAALGARTSSAVVADLRTRRESLARAAARLQAMSPLAVLSRGYAVLLDPRGRALV